MDFGKTAGMSVATNFDEIRRRSMETMSNIPLNLHNATHKGSFYVKFMSSLCQKPLRICNIFYEQGLDPPRPPSLLNDVKKNCRIGAALHPLIIREKLII